MVGGLAVGLTCAVRQVLFPETVPLLLFPVAVWGAVPFFALSSVAKRTKNGRGGLVLATVVGVGLAVWVFGAPEHNGTQPGRQRRGGVVAALRGVADAGRLRAYRAVFLAVGPALARPVGRFALALARPVLRAWPSCRPF